MKKIIICFFIFASACALNNQFIAPDISIIDFKITEVKLLETLSQITVRLDNENNEPIEVKGAVYNIYAGGARLGKAISSSEFTIPALSSVYDTAVFRSGNLSLGLGIKEIFEADEFDYEIRGFIYTDASASRVSRLHFSYSGNFSLLNESKKRELKYQNRSR